MMKIYAAVALAILGVRLAFAFLNYIELVQFFGSAIGGLVSRIIASSTLLACNVA